MAFLSGSVQGRVPSLAKQYLPAQQPWVCCLKEPCTEDGPDYVCCVALASAVGERWAGATRGGAPTPLCRHRRIEGEPDPGACATQSDARIGRAGDGGTGRHTIEIHKLCVFSNFCGMNQVASKSATYG
jgi:hypothetical protein